MHTVGDRDKWCTRSAKRRRRLREQAARWAFKHALALQVVLEETGVLAAIAPNYTTPTAQVAHHHTIPINTNSAHTTHRNTIPTSTSSVLNHSAPTISPNVSATPPSSQLSTPRTLAPPTTSTALTPPLSPKPPPEPTPPATPAPTPPGSYDPPTPRRGSTTPRGHVTHDPLAATPPVSPTLRAAIAPDVVIQCTPPCSLVWWPLRPPLAPPALWRRQPQPRTPSAVATTPTPTLFELLDHELRRSEVAPDQHVGRATALTSWTGRTWLS